MKILAVHCNIPKILTTVREQGYAFVAHGLTEEAQEYLLNEIHTLSLEEGNHVRRAINKNKPNEVHQLHERAYYLLDDAAVPHASAVCRALKQEIVMHSLFPELTPWLVNEIGYQRYRSSSDWISPHRDRRSDKLLSVTFTLSGIAKINIYKPLTPHIDYHYLKKVDSFISKPGTVFFLRAPGFGPPDQIIHEVMPPTKIPRNILNLRMRETLLPSPKNTHYE